MQRIGVEDCAIFCAILLMLPLIAWLYCTRANEPDTLPLEIRCSWHAPDDQFPEVRYEFRVSSPGVIIAPGTRLKVRFHLMAHDRPVTWFHVRSAWTHDIPMEHDMPFCHVQVTAPMEPGSYPLHFTYTMQEKKIRDTLTLIVPHQFAQTPTSIEHVTIGTYPDPLGPLAVRHVWEHHSRYAAPRTFVEINERNRQVALSNLVRLGALAPSRKTSRHFVPIRYSLLDKIDQLSQTLTRHGHAGWAIKIIEGYRTPVQNRMVRGAPYSRHMYGDAATIIIDADHDQRMDDLNKDGNIDFADVLIVGKLLLELEQQGRVTAGGVGLYQEGRGGTHGCKIDLDTRGFPSRWGNRVIQGRAQEVQWWLNGEAGR